MKELSLLDKFKVLFENILDHPLFIVLLFVPIIIFFLQKKHGKKIYLLVYITIIASILIAFGDVIFKLFDNLMDGLFMFLYFPNFITLFIVVLLCSLIALISLFSKKINKVNKIINYVSFGIVQMIFALILITVRTKKINIYADNALYTNNDVLTMMQLLIGTFSLQVVSIIIIYLINRVTRVLDKKDGKLSDSINEQISDLKKKKVGIKTISIDNEKYGFINVADTKKTSEPKLKPFKFNIEKIESIQLNVPEKAKTLTPIILENKNVFYLNEVIKTKKIKIVELDSKKIKSITLNVKEKPKLFNIISLDKKPITYLNEVIPIRKLKSIDLDLSKHLNLKVKPSFFNKISLKDKDVTYLNEVVKENKVKKANIDLNKSISLDVPEKSYKYVSLDSDKSIYSKGEKPDLLKITDENKTHHIEPIIYKPQVFEEKPEEVDLVDNLSIIDIQSTLDVVAHYHLMKGINLKGVDNEDAVDNIQIPDFGLLSLVIKKYKLVK